MRQELAWGTAAAMAIVAAVGISSQSGGKSDTVASAGGKTGQIIVKTKAPRKSAPESGIQPHCSDVLPILQHFFLLETVTGPAFCYTTPPTATPLDPKYQTQFVIATLPDPMHTHFSLLFDRFVEAVQQGAQDEQYVYDSSWLPWETEEPTFTHLQDQDEADDRTEKREDQPGMLLFRGPGDSPYQKALIVFLVGEESTRGIHRPQFENAVAWINALQQPGETRKSVAILGPTFSGSFASLKELLAKTGILDSLNTGSGIAIYSGSTSSKEDGDRFAKTPKLHFRSFVQDDSNALDQLCRYFSGSLPRDLSHLAILSEDETAYGYIVAQPKFATSYSAEPCEGATKIFYPRDISTLRAAYQTQSMFSSLSGQSSSDNVQRKSLPTDLIDQAGQTHDTVRTYAGNQTPLSQEAQLLGIVDVLRAHRIEYVILRSSSTLDPLFLANFLRRDYPEARIVILNADLLFQRGQDAMALSGVMTLSTYPLFSWAREWTALPTPESHSHRVFPENSSEGTYIAARLLLQTLARANGGKPDLNCEFGDEILAQHEANRTAPHPEPEVFAPDLSCRIETKKTTTDANTATYAPLPDYGPPFWTEPGACDPDIKGLTCKPALWLSVITRNGTWPLAALNEHTLPRSTGASRRPGKSGESHWPDIPRSMKISLVVLCGLAVFHLLCCWFASFTAKPAFRAHFATADPRHNVLVLIGSYLIALMALFMGWGSGIFATVPGPPPETWQVWTVVAFVWVVTGAAVLANIAVTRKLNRIQTCPAISVGLMTASVAAFVVLTVGFFLLWVWPLESALVLANRAFVYLRSMNLTSGVSPIVPFLSLAGGLYLWFWYALHGLALFGPDRPCLPPLSTLRVELPQPAKPGGKRELELTMFSQQKVADQAEAVAKPLDRDDVKLVAISFVVVEALIFGLSWRVPVRNLGAMQASSYSRIFCLGLGFYCSLFLCEAWKVWRTWSSARQLLVFLDRMALRRTLSALRGFSWGSVWKMSGNVLDVRYKLLSRQLECLTHLHNSIRLFKTPTDPEEKAAFAGVDDCKTRVDESRLAGLKFAEWYSDNYNRANAAGLQDFQHFQAQVAETTGVVLSKLLMPAAKVEKRSLVQVDPDDDCDEERIAPPPSKNELIRNAEELVCLTYLGFAQNLLGRVRTIVLGGVYLFIAMCIAVSSYPFDPRTLLSGILLCLFIVFGGTVIFVYADMHRDATLSHITNTKPGELGSEFWFKVIGYGAAPLLGLITQVFPEWAGFLFSWLQPGLSTLK